MKYALLILIVLAILTGCVPKEDSTQFTKVSFQVNDSLLAEEFCCNDSELKFRPPLGWQEVNYETLESIKANAMALQDSLQINAIPLKIFIDQKKSFTCFVSTLSSDHVEGYISRFFEINKDLQINEAKFFHNGIDFHQLIFSKKGKVTIKLISVGIEKSFMIDYIVPVNLYEENLRIIESSIGTIKIGG